MPSAVFFLNKKILVHDCTCKVLATVLGFANTASTKFSAILGRGVVCGTKF